MRVDFYLVNKTEPDALYLTACRLLEKAYLRGHRVFVLCGDKAAAELLDELLWTFDDTSFIPHNLQGEGPDTPPPVQIGYSDTPRNFNDILLNLTESVPSFYTRFKRVMQLVAPNDGARAVSREQYRFYRQARCDLHTHNLS